MISTALPSRGTRIAVQALVALGGVAALSWEVIWQLQASLAIGVSRKRVLPETGARKRVPPKRSPPGNGCHPSVSLSGRTESVNGWPAHHVNARKHQRSV
jgi:hypothetical protein